MRRTFICGSYAVVFEEDFEVLEEEAPRRNVILLGTILYSTIS